MIDRTFAHYRILGKLGQGGMGEVFEAVDTRLGRRVALKLLPGPLRRDPGARTRLQREARSAATLDHPFICKIYETAEHEGQLYIAMEFVEGRTLQSRLSEGPLPLAELLQAATEIAEALEIAHEKGLVHRDLKPANIMLGRSGHVKVMDFGLAKQVGPPFGGPTGGSSGPTLTTPGTVLGTVEYMSPEQLRGFEVDARSDIFSFGIVLSECLTGVHPFRRKTSADTASAILSSAPSPCDPERGSAAPALLTEIIRRTLAQDPGDRYQTAGELVRDLRNVGPDTAGARRPAVLAEARTVITPPVSARAAPSWWPPSRRGRWTLGMVGLLAVLALAIVVPSFLKPDPVLSFSTRDWVLIAEFDNQTGDPLFDRSLNTALTISFEQSQHANVFPRSRIADALRRMGKEPGQQLDEQTGREICVRERIRGLVAPSITRVGDRYSLGARIIDPQTGDTVRSYQEDARDQNEILPRLGKLAKALRQDLGESLAAIQLSDGELSRVTTPSLEALKLFTDGVALWNRGRFGEAVEQHEAALRLDPDFAKAHSALGVYYSSFVFNDRVRAREHFEKALSLADRVTERERQSIQISYEIFQGNTLQGLNLSRLYLQSYPDDQTMRYNYATNLRDDGRIEEAIGQYGEVLRLNPNHANSWVNLATCHHQLKNYEESLKAYDRAFALEPAWAAGGNINHEYGFTLAGAGRLSEARQVFNKALSGKSRSQGLRSLALLDMYQGKYAEAEKKLREALLLNLAAKAGLSEARNHVFMSLLLAGKGKPAASVAELDKAVKNLDALPPQVLLAWRVGAGYARAGAVRKAETLLNGIRGQAQSGVAEQGAALSLLEGEIELARGNPAKALASLTAADRLERSPFTIEALARAHTAAGDTAAAVSQYEAVIEGSHRSLGNESQQGWIAAHFDLAKLHQSQGRKEEAAQVIGRLLDIWKEADADLPLLRKARRLRTELTAR